MSEKSQKPLSKTAAINLSGISKSFGRRAVLESISLSVGAGQGLCIYGANAVGKTTLLRITAGLLKPSQGTAEICGFDIQRHTQQTKAMLGVIFHKSMAYPQLTVEENLRFFARLYGIKNSRERIEELLGQTGLGPCRCDRAGILSRGMIQRLAIARALLHKPKVLLADEPFAGLDAEAARHLVMILGSFKNEGGTVVMATHNVNLSLQCCEQAAVLNERKIIFNTGVSEIDTAEFACDYLLYARKNA